MGFWSGVKKIADAVFYFRPKQWFGWDSFKTSSQQTVNLVKGAFTIQPSSRVESFTQAMLRHNISENDLQLLRLRYFYFTLFFLGAGLGLIFYACYGLFHQYYYQALGSLSLAMYVLAQAFRYHFWYFQMSVKRLGCTLKEWTEFALK